MATPVSYPRKAHVDEVIIIPIGTVLDSKFYIPIPNFNRMVTVNVAAGGESYEVHFSNQTRKNEVAAGDQVRRPITDLEDADIIWGEAHPLSGTATDDFFGGDSSGITGVRITVKTDPGPTTAEIKVSVLAYNRN